MNAIIEKTNIFQKIKYDLKEHSKSHKITFLDTQYLYKLLTFLY